MNHRISLVVSVAASLSCTDVSPGSVADTVTSDSAGVSITETRGFAAVPASWRLSNSPVLSIGVERGEETYELSDVRGAIQLSDGRIVVANNGTREIRYYDRTGRHIRTTGRDGAGPGEFRQVTWIGLLEDDSAAVYDRRERRITYLNPDGRYVRDISLQNRDRIFFPDLIGVLSNGTFAAQLSIRLRGGPEAVLGMGRDSVVALTIGRDGSVRDTIGVFPNRMIEVQMRDVGSNRMRLPGTLPFTPRTVIAGGGPTVAVGNTDLVNLRHFSPNGTLDRIVRSPVNLLPITEGHRNYVVDSLRTRWADRLNNPEVNLMIRITETAPLPESFPVFDSLAVDTEGNMWLATYRAPGDIATDWMVYGKDGAAIGLVSGPTGFRASDFGADYVLGVRSDRLGVQRVELYRLNKG